MGITEEGIKAERWFLETAMKKVPVFQPDAITLENGKYILNEVKYQEYFKSPPFDGHGLPPKQVVARIRFFEKVGVRCRLVVWEKGTDTVYYQWLDKLEAGKKYDTRGAKSRRVYPIDAFHKTTRNNFGKK